jgi:hypothetical protein
VRASLEVADIFRSAGPGYRAAHAGHLSLAQLKVMTAIESCRTAALGGHVEACEDCGHWRLAYNSCRNRHCPKCQGAAARIWLDEREADLLPVGYFHVVFTLPAEIAVIALQNKAVVYDLLFKAASETMLTIAADPKHLGARIGITAVLHTWGSAMTHHPHVHMIVPGGGIAHDSKRWIASRPTFLLPVRVLGKLFRRLFLARLAEFHRAGRLGFFGSLADLTDPRAFQRHLVPVRKKPWVVYAKPPFAGPEAVLAYLSRYTHRIAIANRRLIAFDENGVTFRVKDYRRDGAERQCVMTLETHEFIRRFLTPCRAGSIASAITAYSLAPRARPRLPWPATFSTFQRRANHLPSRLKTIVPHAPAAADTWSSLRLSPDGANLAPRRHRPCPPGYPRHDPAWLELLQGRRVHALGNNPARASPSCSVVRRSANRPDLPTDCLGTPADHRLVPASQRVRTSRPHHPEAQFPIAQRKPPAGSSMSRFRTLKRPKSFDRAAIQRLLRASPKRSFVHRENSHDERPAMELSGQSACGGGRGIADVDKRQGCLQKAGLNCDFALPSVSMADKLTFSRSGGHQLHANSHSAAAVHSF